MSIIKKAKEKGLSLKKAFTLMLIVFFVITAVLMIVSVRMILSFHYLADAASEVIKSSSSISVSDYHALEARAHTDLVWTIVLIAGEVVILALMLRLISRLGVNPILHAAECIKRNRDLPVVGAEEFRYLAGTYNKMYDAYTHSIDHLSYLASHDELTGVYNRAGYDLIADSVDLKTSGFILLDVDKFKELNEVYGHKVGDLVLKRIAAILNRNFRSDDYICRLGGDEFVILMVHVNEDCKHLIERKIDRINRDLSSIDDNIPKVALSAGISLCSQSEDAQDALREASIALSHIKKSNRGRCFFYTPGLDK